MGVQSPTEIKASGGWQKCADENVAQKCDAHLAVNNAEALLNSQDVIRRDMLRVKDGENTLALPLMKELLVYGSSHSDICNTVINN